MSESTTRTRRLAKRFGGQLTRAFFEGSSRAASLHPKSSPARHGLQVVRDVSYGPLPEQKLDIWRPVEPGPHPCVLYIHGGGFRILSKETHWIMALLLARRGYVVMNIDYRLAPRHPYPAAIQDACRAWLWMQEHAHLYEGDASRSVVAGESAGANLASGVALASVHAFEDHAPVVREVFEHEASPGAVLAACGLFEVSDPERHWRDRPNYSPWLKDRILEVSEGYLSRGTTSPTDLANPLTFLENHSDSAELASLPPFFLPVGTRDPLLSDTRRLDRALRRHGVKACTRYYPGGVHAFHAFIWSRASKQCWRDTYDFLDRYVPGSRTSQEHGP